mmetsp:Transcript_35164/g.101267  ORF Transcript_35164/g.101267 Transcript_35164/m.101267 type:complete len:220 (-) Transcript_35164:378-1037(-)
MADGDEVRGPVRRDDPEAVVLPPEGVDADALRGVPHADRAVLGVGQDQLLLRVEHDAGHVVEVAPERVDLPRLRVVHPPKLDQAVIRAGHDERKRRVEGRPVHTPLVAFQHVLHHGVGSAEHIAGALRRGRAATADGDRLVPEARSVPHADGLVEGGRHDEILLGMEVRAHHVVVVTREHRDARARLPVPNPDGLVVRCAENPRVLVVELHCADVVEVA